uniref:putative ubiquitin carboxyl-terminal hydrolase 50 isoform X2 n=1 Tax=Solea senegalensis TaxID=28829 RepID=UPI001CD8E407|nr:putative ubiquitin carboxyl-terminal hydrolase 50 isoform X2 [Solea senegalensis]
MDERDCSRPPAHAQPHGLLNQGSTCYLNSVLQVLFMTRDFREAVERHTCENPKSEWIDQQLKDLFDELQQRKAYTYKITNKLGINNVNEQRDAAEYFEKILSLTNPDASQVFHGECTHKTTCSKCHTCSDADGYFWHLPLELLDSYSEDYSVVDGVEQYFRTSYFDGEDQMYCDLCDAKCDATTKCVMKHHPEVLTLLLKRFDFDYSYMRYVKNNRAVDIPFILQIPENQTYKLYAIVDHFGDLRGGHYTATVKSPDDERWYNLDDASVTLINCPPFQGNIIGNSSSVYLLFYKKTKSERCVLSLFLFTSYGNNSIKSLSGCALLEFI